MHSLINRWTYAVSIILVTVSLAACSGSAPRTESPPAKPPAAGAASAPATNGGATVKVVSRNFSFSLDTTRIPAGQVTFVLANEGPAPHDFAIRGNGVDRKTPVIDRGQTASLTVDLKPGTYTYICAIPGHDHLGMQGSLTVA
jgi:plastocyanin